MSRAAGKHGPRERGQLAEEGIGDPRDIPGGRNHVANPEADRQAVPVPEPEWPYRRALLAHGVDPDEAGRTFRDPRLHGGQRGAPVLDAPVPPGESPVPVYIVERAGGRRVIRTAYPRSVQCPASTAAEPVRVCGANENRVELSLLNEDTATDIRFAENPGALAAGTGALLPWPGNSYQRLRTQGEIYAIGATGAGTPRLSVIEVFEDEGR